MTSVIQELIKIGVNLDRIKNGKNGDQEEEKQESKSTPNS